MPKLYDALADAFLAEGVDTQFVLLGDGNMHWSIAFAKLPGVHTVHVRHEHATVAAATAYNVAPGALIPVPAVYFDVVGHATSM
jgi:thiamine pyrophosphate-dependent acetolactate synthase large subunit-like protein